MKSAILFSGGKDSVYTTAKCIEEYNEVVCLINLVSENPASYMFHSVNNHLVELQAEALGIPLLSWKTKGIKEEELNDLKNAIAKAKKKYKIEMIGAGALASQYQYNRVEKIAKELVLEIFTPLWHKDEETLLRQIVSEGYKIMIVAIAAEGTTKEWLGSIIDEKKINKLVELNKKYGSHIMGEGGEYESLVIDCPIFKKEIIVKKGKAALENENTGIYEVVEAGLKDK